MARLEELETFVQVVESGNFTRAADRLSVAKSAVSRRVADLEARLGAQLFRRTTRRLNLTDTGRGFYERAARILADLEEAELAVSQEHGTLRGSLRVAAPLTFGLRHLGPAIREFADLHPEVVFDLDFNDRQIDVIQEGVDVAVRIARLEDSTLVARRLAPVRLTVCASPGFLDRHGSPRVPADLASMPCLTYSVAPDPEGRSPAWRPRLARCSAYAGPHDAPPTDRAPPSMPRCRPVRVAETTVRSRSCERRDPNDPGTTGAPGRTTAARSRGAGARA